MDNYVFRTKPFHFDEEGVRAAFLAGLTPSEICARHNNNERTVMSFIAANKKRWLHEARHDRLVSDERRIVLPYLVQNEVSGHHYVMPISLARNTLHLKQLAAEAGARGL